MVQYDAADASVAAGMLNGFPDGHPITVATLAALMISVSDNTATDILIDLVGRAQVEAAGGPDPLMTTAEYFKIKADPAVFRDYVDAGDFGRRLILTALAERPLPAVGDYANGRTAHGWRLSVRALCDLMAAVEDLNVTTINPGGVQGEAWARVAFKGGNDVGVTNLTYMLTPPDGPPVCLSMTWNYPDHFDDRRVHRDRRALRQRARRRQPTGWLRVGPPKPRPVSRIRSRPACCRCRPWAVRSSARTCRACTPAPSATG